MPEEREVEREGGRLSFTNVALAELTSVPQSHLGISRIVQEKCFDCDAISKQMQ